MSNPTTGTLIVGITAAVVAIVTAVGQRISARAANTGPASVADGYGQLVADLRSDLDRLRRDQAECHQQRDQQDRHIARLETRIGHLEAEVARLTQGDQP